MELEKLEIIIDANAERIEKNLARVMPAIEKIAKSMGMAFEGATDKVEKSMDVSDGTNKMGKQMEQMTKLFEKQMDFMEKQAQTMSQSVGKNMSAGFTKARKMVGKDVDAIVNDINSKIGQAKAKQEQLALLKSQRQGAVRGDDRKGVVKYDNQIATAQAQLLKYQESARSLARQMQVEFDAVPKSLDNIDKKMLQNEGKITAMTSRLKELQAQRANASGDGETSGMRRSRRVMSIPKMDESIANQVAKIEKLKRENESLADAYNLVESRAKQLEPAIVKVNKALDLQSRESDKAGTGMRRFGRLTEGSRGLMSRLSNMPNRFGSAATRGFGLARVAVSMFGNTFNRMSRRTNTGLARNSKGMYTLATQAKMMMNTLIWYGLAYKGVMLLGQGLFSALKANDEFSRSLNEIKVNLLTAFYPIYESVLPMINALMRALSKATAIFAGFIATLFGTTYSAAKQGASGLYDSIRAMNDSGTAADKNKEKIKQMQRSLMGFDEINNLSTDTKDEKLDDKKPGVDFSIPDQKIPDWVAGWANQAKKLWKDFFKPIQDAWKNQGQKVINAWKYALGEIIGLAQAIGKSFMEVWTNGTGQRFVENILKLLATMLNIIGDIAQAFKNAWNDDNRGTKLIQSIFDLWNNVLELLNAVGVAFREAWNDGTGERIAGHILEILTHIYNSLGNIANSWKKIFEGDIGKSIVNGILDIVEILLEKVNDISRIFEEWTSTINFEPLANSFDRLVKAMKPIAGYIGDALAWFLENVLLPIGSYVIQDALPFFFDTLSSVLEGLTSVIKALQPFISWFFDKLLKPIIDFTLSAVSQWLEFLGRFRDALVDLLKLDTSGFKSIVDDFKQFGKDIWNGLKEGISEALSNIWSWMKENIFNPVVDTFKSLFGIHSPSTVFAEFGKFLIEGLYNGIKELMSKPIELVGGIFNDMKTAVSDKTTEIFDKSKELWGKTKETVGTFAGKIKDGVSDKFGGAWEATKGAWNKVTDWTGTTWKKTKGAVGDAITGAKKSVVENTKNILDNMKSRWSDTGRETDKTFTKVDKKVTDSTKSASKNATSRMTDLRNNLRNRFNDTWTSARSNFDNIFNKVDRQSNNANSRGSSAFRNMKSSMVGSLNGLKSTTKSVFDNIGKWAVDLPNRISKGLTSGVSAIKKAAGKIGDGMTGVIGGAVNGVVNGIKWVLNQVGASNAAKKLGSFKAPKYPKYARGTNYHPGGLAMVNDGSGSNYQEAFRTPDGHTGLFPKQRNMVVNLPKGSSVLSGPRTAKMMQGLPAYKNGVGDWFKEKWTGAKKIASDVWSYAKDPGKLLNAAVSKFVNLKGVGQPNLTIAQGAVGKMIDGAKDWVTEKFNKGYEQYQNTLGGTHDGSVDKQWGVFSYLKKIADKAIAKFGGGLRITSGYRGGDPYYHGRRQAIDIALPPNMNGSSKNREIANWAFDNFRSQVAYVITNGMVRDRKGFSGTGASGSWVRWPDNDHYDHVHINGALSSSDIASVGAIGATGSMVGVKNYGASVNRWRGTVQRALQMMGQYSIPNMNATLNQIRTESNGNPKAINLWDINARMGIPSKGLMQVIDPTFRAYSRSPYNKNIYDPLSNILASMRYAISRYGSLTNAYRGVGYENGGWVTRDGIYRMGEGNKREMVVPVDKPSLAMERISQIFDYMGIDWTDPSIAMPSVFEPSSFTQPSQNFANNNSPRYEGGGMQQSFDAMVNGVMLAIQSMGGQPQQTQDGDIIINIGGKEFGRIAVKEINKYHQQLGYTELNI